MNGRMQGKVIVVTGGASGMTCPAGMVASIRLTWPSVRPAPGNTVTGMTAIAYTCDATSVDETTERIRNGSALGIAGEPVDIDAGQTPNGGATRFFSADPALVMEGGRKQ